MSTFSYKMNMSVIYFTFGLVLTLGTMTACKQQSSSAADQAPQGSEQKSKSTTEQINKIVGESLEGIKKELKQLQPQADQLSNQAQGEVEKLFTFEYKVQSVPSNTPATELEQLLTKLGQDRWDCFHVAHVAEQLNILCKRMPKTYLRYIPRVF